MHYPAVKGLENVIFTDLQFVFDRITKLIVNCFTNNEEIRNASVVHNFQNNGTFTKSALDELCARDKGDPLTFDRLVALLEHLYIVAPTENQEYFMPCALKPVEISSTIDRQQDDKISSLLITFECGYVPVGVFCCLIVYLLSSSMWTLAKKRAHNRNKITFFIGEYYDIVILLCHPTYLEVQVQPKYELRDECDDIIGDIFETINTGLLKIIASLHYSYEIKFGILCNPCSFTAPHPAIIKDVKIAYCEYTDKAMNLDSCHLLWYNKINPAATSKFMENDTQLADTEEESYDAEVAYHVLTRSNSDIKRSRIDFNDLADMMVEKGIITTKDRERITDTRRNSADECLQQLMGHFVDTVNVDGNTFRYFTQFLKDQGTRLASHLATKLSAKYKEELLCLQKNNEQASSSKKPKLLSNDENKDINGEALDSNKRSRDESDGECHANSKKQKTSL